MQAIDGSLRRFGLEHIDLIYCHRPDPHTPVEETVRAMSDIITQGKALYWGTSEWSAGDIRAAWEIAERHHLHKPVVEQPQYHLFHRQRVEQDYARLYDDIGLGLTTWSPLASGLLTGKYQDGPPPGSRGTVENIRLPAERADAPGEERRRGAAGAHRCRTGLHAGAAGHRLGGEEPACQQRDHRRVARRAAAVQPGCDGGGWIG
jgi:aryl-alcohol dehydrogenase-like predicted oxidoreductase